jgi:hypothetical protein
MYVNGKMTPVETIPGMGGRVKESSGEGEFKYDTFIHCKKPCNCYSVPPPSTIKKKRQYKISQNFLFPFFLILVL